MLTSSGNYHYLHSSGSWGTASISSLEASDGGVGVYSNNQRTSSTTNNTAVSSTNCKDLKVVLVGKAGSGKSGEHEPSRQLAG